MKAVEVLRLALCIAGCQLVGIIGSFFTAPAIPTWYKTLQKPFFTPPDGVFAPVWITLYTLMGIALFLVWRRSDHPQFKPALVLFFLQLFLNALWSPLFFGLKSPLLGLIDIVLLWTAIVLTIKYFLEISRIAGALLIPYILWVSLATLLNFSLWYLNT